MKRPSSYMTMTDGVTQHDYKRELNKYIDYLEAENKQLILSGVSDIVHRAELKVLENVSDYIPCEIYSQAVISSQKKRDNVR